MKIYIVVERERPYSDAPVKIVRYVTTDQEDARFMAAEDPEFFSIEEHELQGRRMERRRSA